MHRVSGDSQEFKFYNFINCTIQDRSNPLHLHFALYLFKIVLMVVWGRGLYDIHHTGHHGVIYVHFCHFYQGRVWQVSSKYSLDIAENEDEKLCVVFPRGNQDERMRRWFVCSEFSPHLLNASCRPGINNRSEMDIWNVIIDNLSICALNWFNFWREIMNIDNIRTADFCFLAQHTHSCALLAQHGCAN